MAEVTHRSSHPTEEAAAQAAADYKRQWPPQGYGTSTTITPLTNGTWIMSATRWDSCD